VEVWTKGGLLAYYVLFVMERKSRRVHFVGCTMSPNEDGMKQVALDMNAFNGFLNGCP